MFVLNVWFKTSFSNLSFVFSYYLFNAFISSHVKPAPQPLLAHDVPPTLCQNTTTATLAEHGPLPNYISTRQTKRHKARAAGSGEFSFFWSLDLCYYSGCLQPQGNNTNSVNKSSSLYCKNNKAVHGSGQ